MSKPLKFFQFLFALSFIQVLHTSLLLNKPSSMNVLVRLLFAFAFILIYFLSAYAQTSKKPTYLNQILTTLLLFFLGFVLMQNLCVLFWMKIVFNLPWTFLLPQLKMLLVRNVLYIPVVIFLSAFGVFVARKQN